MAIKFLTSRAESELRETVRKSRLTHRPRTEQEDGLVPFSGQPVAVTNNSATDCPAGGMMYRDGSAGSDSDHCGVTQPLFPGISPDLLIADDLIPAGGDGLGWPPDGCEHPIYDPDGLLAVGDRCGAAADTWTATWADLGPITVTQVADANGLAKGICHGKLGDTFIVIDASGRMFVGETLVAGEGYDVDFDSTPGVPALSGG